jgi:triosephosphate isomerase
MGTSTQLSGYSKRPKGPIESKSRAKGLGFACLILFSSLTSGATLGEGYGIMRRKLVAGNWKMNGNLEQNALLLSELLEWVNHCSEQDRLLLEKQLDVAVCVPFPYLSQASQLLAKTPLQLGAQTVSEFASGAYTGEVSAQMLQDFQCHNVIVGHSERRQVFKESNLQIAQKFKATLDAKLIPILCVGETLEQRDQGETLAIVYEQLESAFRGLNPSETTQFVIAYEPIWAIGTGKTATPEQAQQIHLSIRQWLTKIDQALAKRTLILYGGSVKADNAAQLFAQTDIDGALVGGASLKARDFIDICKAVA